MLMSVIRTNETWLICGGRDFDSQSIFYCAMSQLLGMFGCPERIVHGGAEGVDRMAGEWGKRWAIQVVECKADWERHGNAAGPIRNEDMLRIYTPDKVIAFPGGKGTADMVDRARKRLGQTVIEIVPQ